MSDLAQQVRAMQQSGLPTQEIITVLQQRGASLIQSILILKQGLSIPLADARELVLQSPDWVEALPASNDMLDAFLE